MKSTLFGILSFLVKQISEEPGMKKLYKIGKVLHDASERTNECYAMCSELIFVESQRPDLYENFYNKLKKQQYYSQYQFQELDFLMGLRSNGLLLTYFALMTAASNDGVAMLPLNRVTG